MPTNSWHLVQNVVCTYSTWADVSYLTNVLSSSHHWANYSLTAFKRRLTGHVSNTIRQPWRPRQSAEPWHEPEGHSGCFCLHAAGLRATPQHPPFICSVCCAMKCLSKPRATLSSSQFTVPAHRSDTLAKVRHSEQEPKQQYGQATASTH